MQSIKEIMKQLGWEEGSNDEVAKAYIKNLIKAANEGARPIPLKPKVRTQTHKNPDQERKNPEQSQMSFDFSKTSGDS